MSSTGSGNLVMSDATRDRHFAGTTAGKETELGTKTAEGAGIGALIGWNMPEERVKDYEEGIKNGGILMGVRTKNDDDALHFENEWRHNRGEHVYR